jgi:uroporphyrin-3 C-methyltransferase
MNDTPTTPDSASQTASASSQRDVPRTAVIDVGDSSSRRAIKALYAALAVLAILVVAHWWTSQREIRELRSEVASRLQAGDTLNAETKLMVRSIQDSARDLQAKVNVLDNKQAEAQSQQLALQQLYQELAKSRDDWALAEIEQVLSTASQQLQLANNVEGALIALQNADNRLSNSEKPEFIVIRRAIANDLERLRSLPTIDITGIALRLDSLIAQVDTMPLLADEKPVSTGSPPKTPRRSSQASAGAADTDDAPQGWARDWLTTLEETWYSWTNEMWSEMKQLIHIRRVDSSEALLLSPTQAYYVRENLKLRLLNARMALLTRNESAFRSDLVAAQDAISRHFDTRAKQTQVALTILKQVQTSNLSMQMPTLAESLNAVRNYTATP